MMIDSVVWAQYVNVIDRHTDSHVAMANAAPAHCVGLQKWNTVFSDKLLIAHLMLACVLATPLCCLDGIIDCANVTHSQLPYWYVNILAQVAGELL